MTARDLLVERASEYEVRAESCAERSGLDEGKGLDQAAVGFAAVAIALREVADALLEEDDEG